MNRDLLKELLSAQPPGDEIRERSQRARLRALAHIRQDPPLQPARARFTIPAAVVLFAALVLAVIWTAPKNPPPAGTGAIPAGQPQGQPLRITLTLDNGMKVVWTFDDSLSL